MYYLSSENKGADQLRVYREADLRLCFRLCRLLVFPWGGSFILGRTLAIMDINIKTIFTFQRPIKLVLISASVSRQPQSSCGTNLFQSLYLDISLIMMTCYLMSNISRKLPFCFRNAPVICNHCYPTYEEGWWILDSRAIVHGNHIAWGL